MPPEFVVPGEDDASIFPEFYEAGKPKKVYKIGFHGTLEVMAINEERAREVFYEQVLGVIQATEIETVKQIYPTEESL